MTERGKGKSILFIVDGTDRLSGEDSDNFFIRDAYQLRQLRGNFIYCAPIDLMYETGQVKHDFQNTFILPMIKIEEKDPRVANPAGCSAMRDIIYKRAETNRYSTARKQLNISSRIREDIPATCFIC